ncbi:MAG: hypothetical protein P8H30_05255, partial [Luminiphilus sp.]|nr:hypothetical protein [Luminiphilus sp.]
NSGQGRTSSHGARGLDRIAFDGTNHRALGAMRLALGRHDTPRLPSQPQLTAPLARAGNMVGG